MSKELYAEAANHASLCMTQAKRLLRESFGNQGSEDPRAVAILTASMMQWIVANEVKGSFVDPRVADALLDIEKLVRESA